MNYITAPVLCKNILSTIIDYNEVNVANSLRPAPKLWFALKIFPLNLSYRAGLLFSVKRGTSGTRPPEAASNPPIALQLRIPPTVSI